MIKRASQRIHKDNQRNTEKSIQRQGRAHRQKSLKQTREWEDRDEKVGKPDNAIFDARSQGLDSVPRALGSQESF